MNNTQIQCLVFIQNNDCRKTFKDANFLISVFKWILNNCMAAEAAELKQSGIYMDQCRPKIIDVAVVVHWQLNI